MDLSLIIVGLPKHEMETQSLFAQCTKGLIGLYHFCAVLMEQLRFRGLPYNFAYYIVSLREEHRPFIEYFFLLVSQVLPFRRNIFRLHARHGKSTGGIFPSEHYGIPHQPRIARSRTILPL